MSNSNSNKENVSEADIKSLAENISKWRDNYDQFVWLLAEAELKVQLEKQPTPAQIKALAEEIAKTRPSVQDLHWFLAEKTLELNKKK
jgi:hypothetical protein